MGIFSRGISYLLKDFACWTSTHGIPHIGMANALWLRILWVLVVLACLVGFLVQLQTLVTKFLDYSVNTGTNLEYSERPFPVITVCHLNPWKVDAAVQSPYMKAMIDAYSSTSNPNAKFGFGPGRNGARQQRAFKLTTMANEIMYGYSTDSGLINSTITDPAYSYEDMVISCTYNAATCNQTTDFTTYDDPTFGRCIVFNAGTESLMSSRAGPLYGLRLNLRTNQAEYLPWTDSSGIVVSIHNKSENPYPDVYGYYAPPGTASSYGVRYVTTSREPAPYGDCSKETNSTLSNFEGAYQTEACYRSCLQDQIIKVCGCYYPGFDYLGGSAHTSCFTDDNDTSVWPTISDKLDCINSITSNNATLFDMFKECTCPEPCEEQTYSVTASTAKWPSSQYTPTECTAKVQTGQPWMVDALPGTKKNTSLCLAWYKKQTLLIEVFYERMNYQVLKESPAYTLVNLVSDIGGQVGLFLGMSIISVIEFCTLIMLLCFYCASHRSRRQELEELENSMQRAQRESDEAEKQEALDEAKRKAAKARAEASIYDDHTSEGVVPPSVAQAN